MNGSDFYTACQSLISGFSIDSTLFYQLLNVARTNREMMRSWMKLRKYDYTQTVAAQTFSLAFPPAASINIPSDFMFLSKDGELKLYDDNNQLEIFTEVPLDDAIPYLQVNNVFAADHGAGKFYLFGTIQKQYKAFIPYQANLADIASGTSWLNIPSRFHMMLAFDVATMFRLGMDYDDINARNADKNAQDAELLYKSMVAWDDNLQRSATTRRDLPSISGDAGANFNRRIPLG